jgi:hypothetical protein
MPLSLQSFSLCSASILKIVEFCRGIQKFIIWNQGESLSLNLTDFKAIASLPLRLLQISGCDITDDALSPLARCKELIDLFLWVDFHQLYPVLSVIGGKLEGLGLKRIDEATVESVLKYCPNLDHLYFTEAGENAAEQILLELALKRGLKRLIGLFVDDVTVRLGAELT